MDRKGVGWALALLGLAVLGAGGAFSHSLKHWALLLGFILMAVGLFVEVVVRVVGTTRQATTTVRLRRKVEKGYLDDKWAIERSDIDAVYSVAEHSGLTSDGYPRRGLLEERMQTNPKLIRLVYIDEPRKQTPIGYFMIYPLKLSAVKAVREAKIHGGAEIHGRHLRNSWKAPAAIYVGSIASVGGANTWAAGVTTLALKLFLDQHDNVTIFARPATPAGRRLMNHAGFIAIGGHSEVWQRLPVKQRDAAHVGADSRN